MLLTDYTSPAEVRAALGVSAKELSDDTLDLDLYAHSLDIEMQDVAATLPADFAAVAAVAAESRTAAQRRFFSAVKVFAPYAVAVQLASSLPMFAPKTISDGKATVTRDSSAPYQKAIEQCRANYERFRTALVAAHAGLTAPASSVSALRPFLSVVTPATDQVTGA